MTESVKQIRTLGLTRLLVGQRHKFHADTLEQIHTVGSAKLYVDALVDAYQNSIEREYKVVNPKWGKSHSEEIATLDNARDKYLRQLFRSAKSLRNNPDAVQKDATLYEFWKILGPYEGIHNYELQKETDLVGAMLRDMEAHPYYQSFIMYVGPELINQIRLTNDNIAALLKYRVEDLGKKSYIDPLVSRRGTDEIYRTIRRTINAFAIAKPSDDIDGFIDQHNALIGEFDTIVRRLKSGGSGNEKIARKKEENGGIEPKDETELKDKI